MTDAAPRAARALGTTLATLLATTLGAAGCASSGSGGAGERAELLSDWRPPSGQSCTVVPTPATLPPPDALVDASALTAALHAAFDGAAPAGRVLLSLRQDSTGAWGRVAPIEGSLPPDELDRVAETVAPLLTDELVGNVRLLVEPDPDGETRLTVGRQEACGPVVSNPAYVAEELIRLWRQHRREADVLVTIRVDERGRPSEVTLPQSSGSLALDADIRLLAARTTFHPALNDRIPLATYAQLPLMIRQRR
jgi:TonB family protein